MMISYPMSMPYFPPNEIEWVLARYREILGGQGVLSMGPYVQEFEETFGRYIGAEAVATSSCSAALEIALRTLNLEPGDEVILPAETFIATVSSVLREGGRPVFAEINPETFCLAADDLERRISSRTRAVILVHMAGLITPEIGRIQQICRSQKLILIEDAAHAPGASWHDQKSGTLGDMACFSFYPTKVITTGEGGMLVTRDEERAVLARSLRSRGLDSTAAREQYAFLGTNNRMTEFAALLGLSQLRHLDSFIDKREGMARLYTESLLDFQEEGWASPLPLPPETRHSWWRFIVRLPESVDRDRLLLKMKGEGVAIDWAYDPPAHLQPVVQRLCGTRKGLLPITEKTLRHFVCLPIHYLLEEKGVQKIISSFKTVVHEEILG